MDRLRKLLDGARSSPNNFSFRDFQQLLKAAGWKFDRQKGSHQIWYSTRGTRISIQSRGGAAKGYQVRQFLEAYDRESNG